MSTLTLTLRRADRTHDVQWEASTVALLICDVWDKHWCASATARVEQLAPEIQRVAAAAREQGLLIVHCPSNCMAAYEGTAARQRAESAKHVTPPTPLTAEERFGTCWCYQDPAREPPLPIDDSDGGCDCTEPCADVDQPVWTRQASAIEVADTDVVTEDGQELYNVLVERGIRRVCVCGVHLNMCVLGRGFALRQITGPMGLTGVLLRDLTDCMYNPRAPPHVDHFAGVAMVVRHVEAHVCATACSAQLLGAAAASSPAGFLM
jgi:nicotinamidase-related amidase